MAKAKTPPEPPSQHVTIYVNTGTPNSDELKAPGKVFVPKDVTKYQLKGLKSYLKDSLQQCRTSLNRALIIAICADSSKPWLLDGLSSCIDGLPLRLLNYVNLQGQGQSAAAMPYYDNDEGNFTFLLNYPSTSPSHANMRAPTLDFEDQSINFQGMAALILPASRLDESRRHNEPVIILFMANSAMLLLVERHWGGVENTWRMNRLLQCPLWLYIDLLQACGHWSDVWGVAGHDLAWRNTQAYRETSRSSTLHLTRRLHKATSNVITLRENLRLHLASTQEFQEYVLKRRFQLFPMPDDYLITLNERTSEVLQDLHHHWGTSEVILEQFKSLMSLVFNTETVTQGQAVARLNLLAFAFLPLSFVTGIFGMTTWTISAVWYPLWAFAALVLLTIAAYIVNKVSIEDRGESSSWFSHLHWGLSRKPKADVESRSIPRALASAAIAPTAIVTAKMPVLSPTESFLGRTGSYRRNQHGSRRARRQAQYAERYTDNNSAFSGSLHRPVQPTDFYAHADEAPATVPLASNEADVMAETFSSVPMDRDSGHDFYDDDYAPRPPHIPKHVAFEDKISRPQATTNLNPAGMEQEEKKDIIYEIVREHRHHDDIDEYLPPHRTRERERSRREQGPYQLGLDISVHESQAPRLIVPSSSTLYSQRIERDVIERPLGSRLTQSRAVKSNSVGERRPRIGLSLAERQRPEDNDDSK